MSWSSCCLVCLSPGWDTTKQYQSFPLCLSTVGSGPERGGERGGSKQCQVIRSAVQQTALFLSTVQNIPLLVGPLNLLQLHLVEFRKEKNQIPSLKWEFTASAQSETEDKQPDVSQGTTSRMTLDIWVDTDFGLLNIVSEGTNRQQVSKHTHVCVSSLLSPQLCSQIGGGGAAEANTFHVYPTSLKPEPSITERSNQH